MGSSISPILAITYMHFIEQKALSKLNSHLIYSRYVDDCLIILKNKEEAIKCLEVFNSINKNIVFEIEFPDDNNSLNFLDFNLKISENKANFKFYKKTAKKDIFVNFNTSLPRTNLRNICLNELDRRLTKCTDRDEVLTATNEFIDLLRNNDYPENFINNTISFYNAGPTRNKRKTTRNNNKIFHLDIPFISDELNAFIRRTYNKYGIQVRIHHRQNSLRQILSKKPSQDCSLKNCTLNNKKLCMQRNCVYEIGCPCGEFYIGSTKRDLHIRIKEHTYKNSSVMKHLNICGNQTSDLCIKILSRNKDIVDARIHEAMTIHKRKPTINSKEELIDFKDILYY